MCSTCNPGKLVVHREDLWNQTPPWPIRKRERQATQGGREEEGHSSALCRDEQSSLTNTWCALLCFVSGEGCLWSESADSQDSVGNLKKGGRQRLFRKRSGGSRAAPDAEPNSGNDIAIEPSRNYIFNWSDQNTLILPLAARAAWTHSKHIMVSWTMSQEPLPTAESVCLPCKLFFRDPSRHPEHTINLTTARAFWYCI